MNYSSWITNSTVDVSDRVYYNYTNIDYNSSLGNYTVLRYYDATTSLNYPKLNEKQAFSHSNVSNPSSDIISYQYNYYRRRRRLTELQLRDIRSHFQRRLSRLSESKLSHVERTLAEHYDYNYRLAVETSQQIRELQYGVQLSKSLGSDPAARSASSGRLSARETYLSNKLIHYEGLFESSTNWNLLANSKSTAKLEQELYAIRSELHQAAWDRKLSWSTEDLLDSADESFDMADTRRGAWAGGTRKLLGYSNEASYGYTGPYATSRDAVIDYIDSSTTLSTTPNVVGAPRTAAPFAPASAYNWSKYAQDPTTVGWTLMFRQQIRYGTRASLLTRSPNPGALMEYKIRAVNKGASGDFSNPVRVYSGMRCPPVQNFAVVDEDPEFVTLTWAPPSNTGYAPFIKRYELRYAIVTNTTQDLHLNLTHSSNVALTHEASNIGYNYYVNHVANEWIAVSNLDLVYDIPKTTFTADPYYLEDSIIVYTLRAVTHVGNGAESSVSGVLFAG